MKTQENKENEKLQIEIYTDIKSDKNPEVFDLEYDAAIFLKNRFKKELKTMIGNGLIFL